MKRKQKLQKALVWLLTLSLATGSIFAPSPIVKAKTVELRNNPFTYHYEETPLSFVGTYKTSHSDIQTILRFHFVVGSILTVTPFLSVAYQANNFYASFFDPVYGIPGTITMWSGSRKKIATSGITGKSHVVDEWALYHIMFTDEGKHILMNETGKVRMR